MGLASDSWRWQWVAQSTLAWGLRDQGCWEDSALVGSWGLGFGIGHCQLALVHCCGEQQQQMLWVGAF